MGGVTRATTLGLFESIMVVFEDVAWKHVYARMHIGVLTDLNRKQNSFYFGCLLLPYQYLQSFQLQQ